MKNFALGFFILGIWSWAQNSFALHIKAQVDARQRNDRFMAEVAPKAWRDYVLSSSFTKVLPKRYELKLTSKLVHSVVNKQGHKPLVYARRIDMVALSLGNNEVHIIPRKTLELSSIAMPAPVQHLAWSENNKLLAVSMHGVVQVYQLKTRSDGYFDLHVIATYVLSLGNVSGMHFGFNDTLLAIGYHAGVGVLVKLDEKDVYKTFELTSDGRRLDVLVPFFVNNVHDTPEISVRNTLWDKPDSGAYFYPPFAVCFQTSLETACFYPHGDSPYFMPGDFINWRRFEKISHGFGKQIYFNKSMGKLAEIPYAAQTLPKEYFKDIFQVQPTHNHFLFFMRGNPNVHILGTDWMAWVPKKHYATIESDFILQSSNVSKVHALLALEDERVALGIMKKHGHYYLTVWQ